MLRTAGALCVLALVSACANGDPDPTTIDCQEYAPGLETQATQAQVSTAAERDAMRARPDSSRLQDALAKGWRAGGTKILAGLTAPMDGRWVAPGQEPGMASGEYMCATQFDGAHVCSADEILRANDAGEFAGVPAGSEIYVPRGDGFYHEGKKFAGDPSATCNAMTYPTGDRSWADSAIMPGTCNGEQATKLELKLGPAQPEMTQACVADSIACPAVVPTGHECNVKRAIACCR